MVRRGFSLIEMLAVIAIVLVVTAIALPVFEVRLTEARFDAAVRRVDAGMAWARAESQRRGEALRVEARTNAGIAGLFLESFEPASESGRADEDAGGAAQPFAVVEQGLLLSDRNPAASPGDEVAAPARERPAGKSSQSADGGEPLVVATFLPDGSAMATGPFYISGYGRAASLAVNQWTGGVRIKMLDLSAPKGDERERGAGPRGASGAGNP